MILKTKDVEKSLLKKGFIKHNGDHKYFIFICNGIEIGIKTKISHGHSEIGDELISQMAKQLYMIKNFFKDFIECTKSETDYIQMLKDKLII